MSYFGNIIDDIDLEEAGWSQQEINLFRKMQKSAEEKQRNRYEKRIKEANEKYASNVAKFTERYNGLTIRGKRLYDIAINLRKLNPRIESEIEMMNYALDDAYREQDKPTVVFETAKKWWQFWKA